MRAEILNRRKQYLEEPDRSNLDRWTKSADKVKDFAEYFGIKYVGGRYEKDDGYQERFFENSLRLFKAILQAQRDGRDSALPRLAIADKYDALITIVGFSPDPLLHTILALAPSCVYPVVTIESAQHYRVMNIMSDSNLQCFEKIIEIYKEPSYTIELRPIVRPVASIGSIDTFKRVREIIAGIKTENPNAKIALDITGGKKSGDASAFLTAAIEKDIDIFYVDFEEYNDGKPLCGTEFLNKLENPYDLYNIDLINQAKELFRNHNYASAQAILEIAERKLELKAEAFGLSDELQRIREMKKSTEFYKLWDAFEYEDAYKLQSDGEHKQKLEQLVLPSHIKKIYDMENQFDYVKRIALDRFANGERREAQGRYEDAMTRYAQALEIACKSKFIQVLNDEKLTPKLVKEKKEGDDIKEEELQLPEKVGEWEADYAPISGVINWFFGVQNLKWKNDKGAFNLDKRDSKQSQDFLDRLKKKFPNEINCDSKNKLKDSLQRLTNIIEHRNDFIHVSSLSGKKEKMQELKSFAKKMLEVIYEDFNYEEYKFPKEIE